MKLPFSSRQGDRHRNVGQVVQHVRGLQDKSMQEAMVEGMHIMESSAASVAYLAYDRIDCNVSGVLRQPFSCSVLTFDIALRESTTLYQPGLAVVDLKLVYRTA